MARPANMKGGMLHSPSEPGKLHAFNAIELSDKIFHSVR